MKNLFRSLTPSLLADRGHSTSNRRCGAGWAQWPTRTWFCSRICSLVRTRHRGERRRLLAVMWGHYLLCLTRRWLTWSFETVHNSVRTPEWEIKTTSGFVGMSVSRQTTKSVRINSLAAGKLFQENNNYLFYGDPQARSWCVRPPNGYESQ